jgi:hypothetical protein
MAKKRSYLMKDVDGAKSVLSLKAGTAAVTDENAKALLAYSYAGSEGFSTVENTKFETAVAPTDGGEGSGVARKLLCILQDGDDVLRMAIPAPDISKLNLRGETSGRTVLEIASDGDKLGGTVLTAKIATAFGYASLKFISASLVTYNR